MKNFSSKKSSLESFWIYGVHAVQAALTNPHRSCHQLWYLNDEHLKSLQIPETKKINYKKVTKQDFIKIFSSDAVHQGLALQISCLKQIHLEDILQNQDNNLTLVTLDQVTDPHNLGAIARSATAFGVQALIIQDRHSPNEDNSLLYKTASGSLEILSIIRVVNLARALQQIQQAGFWNLGLDETGKQNLFQSKLTGRINLVLGSEGKGLRRLTREFCDNLIHLPTSNSFKTLNVSNAAAIAFYEIYRQKQNWLLSQI